MSFTLTFNPDELDGTPWADTLYVTPWSDGKRPARGVDGRAVRATEKAFAIGSDGTFTVTLPSAEVLAGGYWVRYGQQRSWRVFVPAQAAGATVALTDLRWWPTAGTPPTAAEVQQIEARLHALEQGGGGGGPAFDPTPIFTALTAETNARTAADTALSGRVDTNAAAIASEASARAAGDALALPKAGGAMTGPLTLAGDPTNVLHAATRQWVLARIADLTAGAPPELDTFLEAFTRFQADESVIGTLQTQLAGKQPLDDDLTALAGLVTTAYGRDLLTAMDAAGVRTKISAASVAAVQANADAIASETQRAQQAEQTNAQTIANNATAITDLRLPDTTVTIAVGATLAVSRTNVVTTPGTYGMPAASAGTIGQRFAVRNRTSGNVVLSPYTDEDGNSLAPTLGPGWVRTYRQVTATGWALNDGIPKAELDKAYGRPVLKPVTGGWVMPSPGGGTATDDIPGGQQLLYPFWLTAPLTTRAIRVESSSARSGGLINLGMCWPDASGLPDLSTLLTFGSADCSTTGTKEIVRSSAMTLPVATLLWLAVLGTGTANVQLRRVGIPPPLLPLPSGYAPSGEQLNGLRVNATGLTGFVTTGDLTYASNWCPRFILRNDA